MTWTDAPLLALPAPAAAGYVGCMKHGSTWTRPGTRWYEPQHLLVGPTYYLHAYGSIYALSGQVVRDVIVANFHQLRLLSNEDTSVGAWMMGLQVGEGGLVGSHVLCVRSCQCLPPCSAEHVAHHAAERHCETTSQRPVVAGTCRLVAAFCSNGRPN
jgi:hypothetical protein